MAKVVTTGSELDVDLEILDLGGDAGDDVYGEAAGGGVAADNWLISVSNPTAIDTSAGEAEAVSDFLRPEQHPLSSPSRPSLVTKLNDLKRGSPVRFFTPNASFSSPIFSPFRREVGLSSTPKEKHSAFDSRTFTRNRRSSPSKGADSTFTKPNLNLTFDCDKKDINTTYDKAADRYGFSDTFDLGGRVDDEDRSSNTSEGSSGHRLLNNVGDVQQIAKIQEESLRQQAFGHFDVAVKSSPGSEASTTSPSQEQMYSCRSESSGAAASSSQLQQQQQYSSSQDSLPDSPYSSQSLDSHPAQNPDRLGRSMPNLAKRGSLAAKVPLDNNPMNRRKPVATSGYQLSRHHTSESKLQSRFRNPEPGRTKYVRNPSTAPTVPNRGAVQRQVGTGGATAPSSTLSFRPQAPAASTTQASRLARPARTTGIPRPGSRLPTFQRGMR